MRLHVVYNIAQFSLIYDCLFMVVVTDDNVPIQFEVMRTHMSSRLFLEDLEEMFCLYYMHGSLNIKPHYCVLLPYSL